MPTLAICRGFQLVNVAMGGTLWQDLPSQRPAEIDHRQKAQGTIGPTELRSCPRRYWLATGNVLNAAESAGVSHQVALSVVGTDRLLASGYFRAKNAQEQLIREAAIPFSIVRATQFYEFVGRIADSATDGDTVRISSALCQPMAADDVATAVARTAVGQPVGGILEVAGPDRYPLDDLVRARLRASNDTRRVVTDPQARYFGVVLDDQTLVPATTATVFPTRFADWLIDNAPAPVR